MACTDQVPSEVSGSAHVRVVEVTVNVHVTSVEPDFWARRVTVVPSTSPDRSMVGDATLVMRSVFDAPLSLAVANVGVGGAS